MIGHVVDLVGVAGRLALAAIDWVAVAAWAVVAVVVVMALRGRGR